MFYKTKAVGLYLVLLLFLTLSAAQLSAQEQEVYWYDGTWAHENNSLIPDNRVHFGKLDNGFRYAIIPNNHPAGRVSLYLNIQVGSLMEEAGELGFAHMVEHMAFNGTSQFPPGSLIPFFQKNGMSFGGDTNAHTSLAETVYKLDLATADLETVSTGFSILRDFGGGQLMLEEEVKDEIGVILSEKTARDSESFQASKKRREALYSGTKFVNDVIGTDETIKGASQAGLLNFYQKWYRPERMILVISGEVKPEEITPLIKKQFGDLKSEGQTLVPAFWGEPKTQGVKAFYDKRPISSTSISIMVNHPRQHFRDSEELQKKTLTDGLLQFALQQRLEIRDQKEPGLWSKGHFSINRHNGFLPAVSFSAVTEAGNWKKSFTALIEEMRGALTYGISEAEVERGKEQFERFLERRIKDRASMTSADIASEFINVANDDRVYTSPEDDLKLFQALAKEIGAKDVNQALKEAFAPENRTIYISGDADISGTQEILAAWEAGEKMEIKPYAQDEVKAFPYLALPPESKVLPELNEKSLGEGAPVMYMATLANKVELYLIPVDYEENQVMVSLLFGEGSLGLTEAQIPVMRMAGAVLGDGGVGALTKVETNLLLSTKGISIGEGYGDYAAFIGGSANTKDLQTLLEAIWTQYKDPVPLENSRDKIIQRFELSHFQRHNTVDGVDQAESDPFFYGGTKRFTNLEEEEAKKVTLTEIKTFITGTRKNGPVRIIVTGDFQVKEALPILTRLFGAEKAKKAQKPGKFIKPIFPAGQDKTLKVDDKVDKAVVHVAYRKDLPDIGDQKLLTTRQLAAAVLRDRMRLELREKLGVAYSSSGYYQMSAEDDGFGLLSMEIPTDTGQVAKVREGLKTITDTLIAEDISLEELDRLRSPMRTSWLTGRKKIALWHRLVQRELLTGQPYVEWNNEFINRVESTTPKSVSQEIREILSSAPKASLTVESTFK